MTSAKQGSASLTFLLLAIGAGSISMLQSLLSPVLPTLQAELNTILRDWPLAITGFDSILGRIERDGQGRLSAKYVAQRAWCRANLGDHQKAGHDVRQALEAIDQCADLDDLAVVYSRLSGVQRLCGSDKDASEMQANGTRCMDAFVESRESLRKSVLEVVGQIAPA